MYKCCIIVHKTIQELVALTFDMKQQIYYIIIFVLHALNYFTREI